MGQGAGDAEADEAQCIETGQGYHWHYFDGCFHSSQRLALSPHWCS